VLRYADLFSGCGGLSLGLEEAARALGLSAASVLSIEKDPVARSVYRRNFSPALSPEDPIEDLVDGEVGERLTVRERELRKAVGNLEFVLAGPPCQGHSDLNNHTRREDPKNALYGRAVRFAEILDVPHVLIENVPGAVHDRGGVVQDAIRTLRALEYHVEGRVLHADRFGVPQRRRRFLLVASKRRAPALGGLEDLYETAPRTLRWACEDLLKVQADSLDTFNTSAVHSAENQRRINYLFELDLHDLPNEERPDCHRLKDHSYTAVYGRLHWEAPAPTITGGFGSTGQGRFVHPLRPRTLTPHEAARVQFIPDFFRFGSLGRRSLQTLIGNAVPPKLAYLVCLELLR
jgi:DNA (cytosine-5)-methyltransferase 1